MGCTQQTTILDYPNIHTMETTNTYLILSSLCFLFPSFFAFHKHYFVHSFLCFNASIVSTLYWCDTDDKQMLLYDKCAAAMSCVFWAIHFYFASHKYKSYVVPFYSLSAICYVASLQVHELYPDTDGWVTFHVLFHVLIAIGGSIYFASLDV